VWSANSVKGLFCTQTQGPSTSHPSASRARTIAGLSGFFTLIQSRCGPDRYGALSRFTTQSVLEDRGAVLGVVVVTQEAGECPGGKADDD
jgi:hypothetical protein